MERQARGTSQGQDSGNHRRQHRHRLATAKRFVEEGAYVFISGRRQTELDAAVKELGDNVTGVQGDVAKAEDLDRLYAAVADSGRRLDVVFANAATIDVARIGDIPTITWTINSTSTSRASCSPCRKHCRC
jgi:NAD(P)-dependent dehydrogenase (short-subunit alcohol dehydrogenase family)